MKFLHTAFKNFAALGICRGQNLFNARTLKTLAFYWLSSISIFIFLIYEASDFNEYTHSIFTTFSSTTIAIVFTIFAIKMKRIFELVDIADEFTEKSE